MMDDFVPEGLEELLTKKDLQIQELREEAAKANARADASDAENQRLRKILAEHQIVF